MPIIDCIFQDSLGFLWFGTYGGLYQYDGYEFDLFVHKPEDENSLGDNKITRMLEDYQGNIVIGTQAGLHYLNLRTRAFHKFDGIEGTIVYALVEDAHDNLWVGARSGVYKLIPNHRPDGFTVEEVSNVPFVSFVVLYGDDIIFSDRKKIYQVHQNSEIEELEFSKNGQLKGDDITSLFVDSLQHLWIGTNLGIHRIDIENRVSNFFMEWPYPNLPETVNNMMEFAHSRLLINSSHGPVEFNSNEGEFKNVFIDGMQEITDNLSNPQNFRMLKTRENHLILARGKETWICDLSKSYFKFIRSDLFQNLAGPGVFPEMFEVEKNTLLVCDINGPRLVDCTSGISYDFKYSFSTELSRDPTWLTSYCQKGDSLWVGTDNGVFLWDRKNKLFKSRFPTREISDTSILWTIRDVLEDSKHNLWIATWSNGLYRLDLNTNITRRYHPMPSTPSAPNGIWSFRYLYEDQNQHVWIGSRMGLLKYRPEVDSFILYQHNDSDPTTMSENTSFCIYRDTLGYIWSGSYGGGLNRLDTATDNFVHFTIKDGLLDNNIFSLIPDDQGNLWMLSYKGVSRFNPYTHEVLNLTSDNGLGSTRYDAFMYGKSPYTGDLYFVGDRGIDIFHPDSVELNFLKPAIIFTDFELFNETVKIFPGNTKSDTFFLNQHISYVKEIRLNYHHRVFTINYTALDFSGPANIQYAYRMSGFDQDWQYVGKRRSATYTNLDPGKYEFQVKSTNADGVWNEDFTALAILIAPPWWNTTVAYLFYLFLISGAIYLFFLYQRRRWELRTALQIQEREALRLKELDALKTNLYTNITHEFRTPLTVIGGMTQLIKEKPKEWTRRGIHTIEQQSEKLLTMINQMLALQKAEAEKLEYLPVCSNIITYLNFILEPFQFQATSKGLTFIIEHEKDFFTMDFDPDKLSMVISNLVSNAIKFTEHGRISFKTEIVKDDLFQILLSDTGMGIPDEKIPHIFERFYQAEQGNTRRGEGTGIGLSLVRELVPLMSGNIQVNSTPGDGSTFILQLKISREARLETIELRRQRDSQPFPESQVGKNLSISRPTVLIIEDHTEVRQYLRTMLENDFVIIEAVDGNDGIARARKEVPDLIISDVMMPEKDGYTVCEELHKDVLTDHIPIILLTARADTRSRIEGYGKGADVYLPKPFHPDELRAQINMLLLQRQRLQKKYQPGQTDQSIRQKAVGDRFLSRLCDLLDEHLSDEDFGIDDLCRQMLVSRSQLHKKIKATTGLSTSLLIRKIRLEEARKLIRQTDLTIAEIAYQVGFKDPNFFSRVYRKEFGESPREGRRI